MLQGGYSVRWQERFSVGVWCSCDVTEIISMSTRRLFPDVFSVQSTSSNNFPLRPRLSVSETSDLKNWKTENRDVEAWLLKIWKTENLQPHSARTSIPKLRHDFQFDRLSERLWRSTHLNQLKWTFGFSQIYLIRIFLTLWIRNNP